MKSRRRLLVALGAGVMIAPFACFAQANKGMRRRIGWIEPGTPASFPARRKAFNEVMRQAGFVEGTNLVIDYRYGHGKLEQFPTLAKELVALKPECLVAIGVDTIAALRQATSTIPIVMGTIDADPVKEGLVASMPRPGGNITGMVGIAWELAGKRLELLREIDPKISKVAVLFDPRSPAGHAHLKDTENAARALKVQLQVLELRERDDIEQAFRAARTARAHALFVIAVGMLNSHRGQIVALANETRLPAIYSNVEFVADGGMIGYAPNMVDQFRLVGNYVDKILKGAKPADLPIVQPTQFELAINLKTARTVGARLPKSILARADLVIE